MSKVCVITAHDARYAEMASITMPSLMRYCAKHNYELWVDDNIDPREGDFCKIRLFRELYATGNYSPDDFCFWIDTDALVMNSEVKLEDVSHHWLDYVTSSTLWGDTQGHYLVGYDPNGINTGTWLARFSSKAEHFLRVATETSASMGWADQVGLLMTALQPTFRDIVRYCPGRVMNSMPYRLYGWNWQHGYEINAYEDGNFVVHLPAIELPKRLELLREYARGAK
jgi:hypothetical protein